MTFESCRDRQIIRHLVENNAIFGVIARTGGCEQALVSIVKPGAFPAPFQHLVAERR